MADKMADLSPEEKEKRIAEMKAKMQAAAAKAKATSPESGEAKPASKEAPKAAVAPVVAAPTATATAVAAAATVVAEPAAPKAEAAAVVATNGANGSNGTNGANGAALAAPVLVAEPPPIPVETAEQKAKKEMNRREFLTYAWGAALGLLLLETGAGIYFFMYPRFRAGEFGGKFFIGPVDSMPAPDAPPEPFVAGKFWLVTTPENEPRALYMVCTHLGCLYKWAQSNNRFECPCHGSKFSHDGYYIEGPAPRSLDTFLVEVVDGQVSVDTGKKTLGAPSAESPARAVPA